MLLLLLLLLQHYYYYSTTTANTSFFFFLIFFGFFFFIFRQAQGAGNQAFSFGKSKARMFTGDKPTVTFDDRLVLETRFGLRLSHVNEDRKRFINRIETDGSSREDDQGDQTTWRLDAFGQNLGPGATMQFIIYF